MDNHLIYLASPYSAPTPKERIDRFIHVSKKAAQLMEEGHQIFCPIAHSHPIEAIGMKDIHDGDFWLHQDFAILEHAKELWVYQIPGWDKSEGIKREIAFAETKEIPVKYIYPEDGELVI